MNNKIKLAALALAVAGFGFGSSLLAVTDAGAQDAPKKVKLAKKVPAGKNCVTKRGKGFAWSVDSAKFQAWEIIAQTTGNWPIATDKLVNERYKCAPDGSGYTCFSGVDVCKD